MVTNAIVSSTADLDGLRIVTSCEVSVRIHIHCCIHIKVGLKDLSPSDVKMLLSLARSLTIDIPPRRTKVLYRYSLPRLQFELKHQSEQFAVWILHNMYSLYSRNRVIQGTRSELRIIVYMSAESKFIRPAFKIWKRPWQHQDRLPSFVFQASSLRWFCGVRNLRSFQTA